MDAKSSISKKKLNFVTSNLLFQRVNNYNYTFSY